ncbi:hypothetical protein NQ314_014233 [Rhamnusium bicolor]|uniref:ZAD domain-containing protein n=1 Tax=Rhamnusium bicolor TaxID=1586634 RepID=A0AAV8X2L8_9CUCU|nr:hypothetical protein NQ314_014233 [Rhamnusium bicolor]
MNERTCRFCLKTCRDFRAIGESLRDSLDKLVLLKLNLSISKETVMCNDCKNNMQVFLNIKSASVYLKNRALPLTEFKDDSLNREEIDSRNNGKAAVESNDEITCWFCTKASGREGLVPLNESKENAFVVDMLNEHIPELVKIYILHICLKNALYLVIK